MAEDLHLQIRECADPFMDDTEFEVDLRQFKDVIEILQFCNLAKGDRCITLGYDLINFSTIVSFISQNRTYMLVNHTWFLKIHFILSAYNRKSTTQLLHRVQGILNDAGFSTLQFLKKAKADIPQISSNRFQRFFHLLGAIGSEQREPGTWTADQIEEIFKDFTTKLQETSRKRKANVLVDDTTGNCNDTHPPADNAATGVKAGSAMAVIDESISVTDQTSTLQSSDVHTAMENPEGSTVVQATVVPAGTDGTKVPERTVQSGSSLESLLFPIFRQARQGDSSSSSTQQVVHRVERTFAKSLVKELRETETIVYGQVEHQWVVKEIQRLKSDWAEEKGQLQCELQAAQEEGCKVLEFLESFDQTDIEEDLPAKMEALKQKVRDLLPGLRRWVRKTMGDETVTD